jgi:hypothetical protein
MRNEEVESTRNESTPAPYQLAMRKCVNVMLHLRHIGENLKMVDQHAQRGKMT